MVTIEEAQATILSRVGVETLPLAAGEEVEIFLLDSSFGMGEEK